VHIFGFIIRIYHDTRSDVWHCCVYSEKLLIMGRGTVLLQFYSKNKFEKLVHLIGFIIRIYHDARSDVWHCCVYSEKLLIMGRGTVLLQFYSKNKFEKLVHLVGFIIRIYHYARSPERKKSLTEYYLRFSSF